MRDQCASILVISDGSRPPHKGEKGGHPDLEIGGVGGGGVLVSKKLRDQFGLKRGRGPAPGPLLWIRHW